jgi:hypothetical protein
MVEVDGNESEDIGGCGLDFVVGKGRIRFEGVNATVVGLFCGLLRSHLNVNYRYLISIKVRKSFEFKYV